MMASRLVRLAAFLWFSSKIFKGFSKVFERGCMVFFLKTIWLFLKTILKIFPFYNAWCSVKISDTDFVEFPSIKSVSFLSKLPFWQQNVFCNTFSHIQMENDIRNNYGFSWCCNMHQCIRIQVDMHDCNCESQICSAILF